ncbi:Rho-related GTP-binding protein RhoN, partial [Dissostichus eleginoides]
RCGQLRFSSCVSTTDTGINSSAAELRADPWKGLTMKPCASFQVATILDQPNLKCFAFALKVNFKRKTAAGDIKDAGCNLSTVGREQGTMDSRLNKWGYGPRSSYYDNVRPLAYPDSDAVLICFDISRPETLDSVIKKWQGETQEFCPNAKVVLVGCKLDMRTDVSTLRELSKQRLIPVTHEQGSTIARQMGAVAYVECTSKVSENSVRDVFHITTVASVQRAHKPQVKRSSSRRGLKRVSQLPLPPLPGRTEQMDEAPTMRKDRAKSCVLM